MLFDLKKGQELLIKTPPYFEKEYVYEVISAGEKQIRAGLKNSPKVKKSWTNEEFAAMVEHGLITIKTDKA